MTMLETTIPFQGFYESELSGELDSAGDSYCESQAEEDGETLSASEIGKVLYWCADWSAGEKVVAEAYAGRFNSALEESTELVLGMTYKDMESPREYNFTTDRVFMQIPLDAVQRLMAFVPEAILGKVIRDDFTSRDGFMSWYSNDITEWLAKPLETWDHNEVGTLVKAALLASTDADDVENSIICELCEGSVFDAAFDKAVDWPALENKLAIARAAKGTPQVFHDPAQQELPL